VIHVVKPGDTLLGIAIQYGVGLEELQRLNAGTLGPNNLIVVGQELVISGTAISLPTPTATPQATAPITTSVVVTTPATPATVAPTPLTDKAALCVLAYNDANADLMRQTSTESLVPGAVVSLVGMNGPAGSYTTDGISEPYCFQNLEPGNYILRQTPATGYTATGPAEWGVLLGAGQTYALEIGYAAGASPAPAVEENTPEATEPTPTPENDSGKVASTLMKIVQISGIIVAVLAVGVGVLFFLSRRKM